MQLAPLPDAQNGANSDSSIGVPPSSGCRASLAPLILRPTTRRQRIVCWSFWVMLVMGIIALLVWAFPKLVTYVIDPAMVAMQAKLTNAQIAVLVAAGIILVPMVFITSAPFEWVAAIVFSFGGAFALITAASVIGVALPYALAATLLRRPVTRLLDSSPASRTALLAVHKAGPWRVLFILRFGPVPYGVVNYVCGLPVNILWWQYMLVSQLSLVPGHAMSVFFGRNLQGISDLLQGQVHNSKLLAYNLVGLLLSFIAVVLGFWFARRALHEVRVEQEAETVAAEELSSAALLQSLASEVAAGQLECQGCAKGGQEHGVHVHASGAAHDAAGPMGSTHDSIGHLQPGQHHGELNAGANECSPGALTDIHQLGRPHVHNRTAQPHAQQQHSNSNGHRHGTNTGTLPGVVTSDVT